MSLINRLLASALPAVPKSLVRKVSSRYIAGDGLADAVAAVTELAKQESIRAESQAKSDEANAERARAEKDLRILDAIEKARKAGGEVVAALVVIDREEGGREAVEAELNGAPLYALFGASELLG